MLHGGRLREILGVCNKDEAMPTMKLDAVSVTSKDLVKSAKFYALLGFEFPEFVPEIKHLEPITAEGNVRLMIDDWALIRSMTGIDPAPPTHSSFAMMCNTPAEVDRCVDRVRAAGFKVVKDPWDAFWDQRYAIVMDPDDYMVDIFAWT
jgi:predicted lactoylglutathione lyase